MSGFTSYLKNKKNDFLLLAVFLLVGSSETLVDLITSYI